jgi:hypothetical protein
MNSSSASSFRPSSQGNILGSRTKKQDGTEHGIGETRYRTSELRWGSSFGMGNTECGNGDGRNRVETSFSSGENGHGEKTEGMKETSERTENKTEETEENTEEMEENTEGTEENTEGMEQTTEMEPFYQNCHNTHQTDSRTIPHNV